MVFLSSSNALLLCTLLGLISLIEAKSTQYCPASPQCCPASSQDGCTNCINVVSTVEYQIMTHASLIEDVLNIHCV